MSNIDKHALRGQSVEGSYYLAECGYCGQVMPSSKLRVLHSPDGEADCYCPHCNAEDCEIFDLGTAGSEVVNAWNYQQKRVEALLDELEAAESRIAELEAREVNLPKRSVGEVMHMSGFSRDYAEGWCSGNDNAIHEIHAAGIKVAAAGKGE